jgi:hypothetical protein
MNPRKMEISAQFQTLGERAGQTARAAKRGFQAFDISRYRAKWTFESRAKHAAKTFA